MAPFLYPGRGRSRVTDDAFGAAALLSLACHAAPANLTLSLGFRYQMLHHANRRWSFSAYYASSPLAGNILMNIHSGREIRDGIDTTYDHFYGLAFTAVYAVHFGAREPR